MEQKLMAGKQEAGRTATPLAAPLMDKHRMSLVVGIATRGRPLVLSETLADLSLQRRTADRVIVAYVDAGDIGDAPSRFPEVIFQQSELGLTRQRNAILKLVKDVDVLIFIDDDFYLQERYLEVIEGLFYANSDIVVATGKVLADGIHGPGLSVAEARSILAKAVVSGETGRVVPIFNAYGCNMCLRIAPICEHGLWFDERLPLYAWWEDVDFSRQLARFGSVVQIETAQGVHLGVKSGRTSGMRLGYSQVANPIYLARKGTLPWSHAAVGVSRRFLRNLFLSLAPPSPHVDRRGRLSGNLIAFGELFTGKLGPERALALEIVKV